MTRLGSVLLLALAVLVSDVAIVRAHSGPPFPVVSNQIAGAYNISVWTDPDTTDDRTAAGQFWIVIEAADRRAALPATTTATVAIRPLARPGATLEATASPVNGDAGRQFVALLMDHEGRFGVRVRVDGPLGRADVESTVDATYDARPPAAMLAVYLFPFLAIGALWAKVLLRRRKTGVPQR